MRRLEMKEKPISAKQYELLLQASKAEFGRIYQADIGGGGVTASAWHRSCRVLVKRGFMQDVSSAGVYQITDSGRAFIGGRVS
jgi:hypothetical protein